jgi:anti-sigma B factor antagonist
MDLTLAVDVSPPDVLVRANGELDLFSAHQLGRRLNAAVDAGCRRVLLDLAEVDFVDAGALRVLDRFRGQLYAAGGSLRIVACSTRFEQLCRATGLDAAFGLTADAQPA